VASGTVDAARGAPAKIEARLDWGRYRLEVSDDRGLVSSTVFNTGFWADESADSPEMLDVALDKDSYRPGDTARVKIGSRMAGRALIAVLSSGLLTTQEVDLPAGGGEVPIKIGEGWNPGAYVAVTLYRPLDEGAKRMPGRALGLRWLAIDRTPRTIGVNLGVPETLKSGAVLTVPSNSRPCARRDRPRHSGGDRCRHTEPHALRGAQAGPMVLRPAPARQRIAASTDG
jgi:uncharacterized protein YfaS (alpha-2-macroglobulin family)